MDLHTQLRHRDGNRTAHHIWVFLVHMMISQAPDAHLEFLLDVMAEQERSKAPVRLGRRHAYPMTMG